MAKVITLTCPVCKCKFDKALKEYNRQIKNKGEDYIFYCSLSCYGKGSAYKQIVGKYINNLNKGYNNSDKFSLFRNHLKKVRSRCKASNKLNYDIDLQYLYDL